jgi:hypothetical protein
MVNVCTCRSQLWRLSRRIPLEVAFTVQKTLAMTSPAEVCTLNFYCIMLSYRPDLIPSDFHFLGHLKDALWGRRLADEDELKHSVYKELRHCSREQSVSRKCGKSVLIMETLWKTHLKVFDRCSHDILIYVHFITIKFVIKIRRRYFRTALCMKDVKRTKRPYHQLGY